VEVGEGGACEEGAGDNLKLERLLVGVSSRSLSSLVTDVATVAVAVETAVMSCQAHRDEEKGCRFGG
jgi:hypothetical protein